MERAVRAALVALALGVAICPVAAAVPPGAHSTVVVVLAPYVTWDDVDSTATPVLARLAADGALACVSVRAGSVARAPDDLRGAAVLSAGQPVSAPATSASMETSPYGVLGEVVRAAGGRTVAIGSDALSLENADAPMASAAFVVAADKRGQVDVSYTGSQVLRADPAAPMGMTADLRAFEHLYASALDTPRATAVPTLVVLAAGDGARARAAAAQGASWEAARAFAVRSADALAGVALRSLPPDAVLVVLSTAEYAPASVEGFGPLLVLGSMRGVLHSAGTHRAGIVALPDVTASILSLLGLDVPGIVGGASVAGASADNEGETALDTMRRVDASARALEVLRGPVWFGFIGVAVVGFGIAAGTLCWPRLRRVRAVRRAAGYLLLSLLSVPLGALIAQVAGYPDTVPDAWWRLGVCAALVAASVLFVGRNRGFPTALGVVTGATALLVGADQLAGGRLAYGGVFSYSALFGTRFYGLGNEGAAVLVAASLVTLGLAVDRHRAVGPSAILWTCIAVVGIAVAPFLGANLGVAAWGTGAFVVAWAYAARRRVTWGVVLAGGATALTLVGIAVLIDRVSGTQSHIGRFIDMLLGGGGGIGALLARKAALSLEILKATPLVLLLPLAVAGSAYALVRPRGEIAVFVERHRGLAAALAGTLVAAAIGALTEDSGIVVGALAMLYGFGAPLVAALADEPGVAT